MEDVRLNIKSLEKFTAQMRKDAAKHEAHIGILAAEQHEDDDFTTASLAAVHEFGSISQHIPQRSFFALTETMKGKEMQAFMEEQDENIFKKVMSGKSKEVLSKLAAKWNAFIHECFETEGFGTWLPMSDATRAARIRKTPKKKKASASPQLLQDTGALERSITFEVK
jgi:phage gpG-like protein